jgi:adenosylcobinamide-GDP ribazoletransferase
MAIAAVVCVLALKMAAVASLPLERSWERGAAILLMALAGRCALVWEMAVLRYTRPEGGLAAVFATKKMFWPAAWALVLLAAAGWLVLAWAGLLAAGAAVLVTLLFCLYCYRKIGGYTGDTLGAACEIAELVPALVIVGLAQHATV